jgi:hypothetical protein
MNTKYPRTMHFPYSPGAKNDDRIAFDSPRLLNTPVVFTEKLDGENTCLNREGVFARSHGAPTLNPWAQYLKPVWQSRLSDLTSLNIDLFGESLYGIHSIEYESLSTHFYVFAVRYRSNGEWASWGEIEEIAALLEFPVVPVLGDAIPPSDQWLRERVEQLSASPSAFGGEREGVVVRVASRFAAEEFEDCVRKWVRKGHVQTDQFWARNWKRAPLAWEKSQ